jgi:GNAT superfamily N-acetyltransferase
VSSVTESELTVRRFEPGDGARVREVAESAMADTLEYVPDAPDEDLQDVPGHYLDADGEFLVGVVAGEVVATGAYEPLDGWMVHQFDLPVAETAELTRMLVLSGFRGEGVGTAIYRALAEWAPSDGYRSFVLNTGVENDRARGFYESRGFEFVGAQSVEFDDVALDLGLYQTSLE